MSDEQSTLACWRVTDLDRPKSGSVRGYSCVHCGYEVWVMRKNLGHGLVLLCRQCAAMELAQQLLCGEEVEIRPAAAIGKDP